jgi:hypothetical protein
VTLRKHAAREEKGMPCVWGVRSGDARSCVRSSPARAVGKEREEERELNRKILRGKPTRCRRWEGEREGGLFTIEIAEEDRPSWRMYSPHLQGGLEVGGVEEGGVVHGGRVLVLNLFVLIRQGLRGGPGPQRLIRARGEETRNPIMTFHRPFL